MSTWKFPGCAPEDAKRLHHLKRDPLWTQAYQDRIDRSKEHERQLRIEQRRQFMADLIHRPRLALAKIVVRLLRKTYQRADDYIISHNRLNADAAFEQAAAKVLQQKDEARRCAEAAKANHGFQRERLLEQKVVESCQPRT